MIEITFNTAENKITVLFDDETTRDYTNRASYLADFPEREADCAAMGW